MVGVPPSEGTMAEDDSSIVSLQADLRFTSGGSLHLRGLWRRIGLLVGLCLFCAVLRSLRFRDE